jgi:hypothetical protein
MTSREGNLKYFLENVIGYSVKIFNEINLKNPLKQKKEEKFEFKNNFFNKTLITDKNDFQEFFSRKEIKLQIENIKDFNFAVDIISGYSNTKIYSKRGLNAKNMLDSFIENYFISNNAFKFSKLKFDQLFKNFIKFLDSDILQVYYFTPLFKLDFPSTVRQKDLGDIKLTQIDEIKFKIIKDSMVGTGSVPGIIHRLSYVLETTVPFQDDANEEDSIANKRFENFLHAAHLFAEGDLKTGPIYKNFTLWMNNSSKILNETDVVVGSRTVKLNSGSYKNLKTFYNDFLSLDLTSNDWDFIQVSLERFSSSILRDNPIDTIVDLNVALECMFSSPGETSLKIANRSALMYGSDESKQEECWTFIKNVYRLRNNILHGRQKNNLDITKEIIELENIIRFSIRKFLNLSTNISKKELKSQKKLDSGMTVRDYLLTELDLSLINRTRLDNFLIISDGPFS